jgi:hypothetical protein
MKRFFRIHFYIFLISDIGYLFIELIKILNSNFKTHTKKIEREDTPFFEIYKNRMHRLFKNFHFNRPSFETND